MGEAAEKPKVTIIANCHTGPLTQMLAFNTMGIAVDGIAIDSWFDPASDAREKAQAIHAAGANGDWVFSFNLAAQFEALETPVLRQAVGENFATFTNIRFDGLHPDCAYLGRFGERWPNFLSEYHSKIVALSFASGRDEAACLALLNGKTYEALGYYNVFAASEAELRQRDLACDVKFCDVFFGLIRQEYALLTINHPTSTVFHHLLKLMCRHAGLPFVDFNPAVYPNPLVQAVIWPTYHEVAEFHLLKYRTPQFFSRPPDGYFKQSCRPLSIPEFVSGSYQFYGQHFSMERMQSAVVEFAEYEAFSGL